jgi:hypothetical protein
MSLRDHPPPYPHLTSILNCIGALAEAIRTDNELSLSGALTSLNGIDGATLGADHGTGSVPALLSAVTKLAGTPAGTRERRIAIADVGNALRQLAREVSVEYLQWVSPEAREAIRQVWSVDLCAVAAGPD